MRVVVIGLGRIGSTFDDDPKRKLVATHCGAYSALAATELVAVADDDAGRLAIGSARWGVDAAYSDARTMLAEVRPDIVSIATHADSHLDLVRASIEAGARGIWCEKPIAGNAKAAREMVQLCETNGVVLQIDHQRRFDPIHRTLRDWVANGGLGQLQHAYFLYTAGAANTGTHLLDLLRWFFGDVQWVEGRYSANLSPSPDDPNIDAVLQFTSGLRVNIDAYDVKRFLVFDLDIVGSTGRLLIARSGNEFRFEDVRDSTVFSGCSELARAELPISLPEPVSQMVEGARELVTCVETNRASVSSGRDGLAALELVLALRQSAENDGARIALPLD